MENGSQTEDDLRRQRNREASARYRERHREKFNRRMREWRENNREQARKQSRDWRNRKLETLSPDAVAAFRAAEANKTRRLQQKIREEVFAAYGGFTCNCCGETEQMFLSIDHVENNGAAERKAGLYSGSGTGFYQWLRKQGFPSGYQVLCMNCQTGKHKNGGVCPHQTLRTPER
jgi:hypothetical protein